MASLEDYLVLGAVMFICGVICALSRKNAIGVLMGIELILNGAGLNFIGFSRFTGNQLDGQMFALFIIVIAAAEAAVALSIVLRIYHNRSTIEMDEFHSLKR
jgi:NADH-quinone oxidoreductase subunit K